MIFSEGLREARNKAGLTQEELSRKMGVSRATIISWEKGVTAPDGKELNQLSKLFDIDLTNLTSNSNKKEPDLSEEIRLLIKNIDRMGMTNEYLLNKVKELEDQLRGSK